MSEEVATSVETTGQEFELNPEGVGPVVRIAATRLAYAYREGDPVGGNSPQQNQSRGMAEALETMAHRTDGQSWAVVIGDEARKIYDPAETPAQETEHPQV